MPDLTRYLATRYTERVLESVVAFSYADEATDWPTGSFGGNGTCIQVGERYLVATAAHVLHAASSVDRIQIISTFRRKATSPRVRLRATSGGTQPGAEKEDYGLLEFEPRAARSLEQRFVQLGECSKPPSPGQCGLVVGAPGTLTEVHDRGVTLNMAPYCSPFLQTAGGAEGHLCLSYPTESMPSPGGLSGSAVWHCPDPVGLIPDLRPRLCGVVVAHDARQGSLLCLPIEGWLRLAVREFPELELTVRAWAAGR